MDLGHCTKERVGKDLTELAAELVTVWGGGTVRRLAGQAGPGQAVGKAQPVRRRTEGITSLRASFGLSQGVRKGPKPLSKENGHLISFASSPEWRVFSRSGIGWRGAHTVHPLVPQSPPPTKKED